MNFNTIKSFCYSAGHEALTWAPVAIALTTKDPSLIAITEISYAAMQLHQAYLQENKWGKLSALTSAALSIAAPLTYHPQLKSFASTVTKGTILTALGTNNVIRGVYETAAVFSKNKSENSEETNTNSIFERAGKAFRLSLGIFRIYSGGNQVKSGLQLISPAPSHTQKSTFKYDQREAEPKPAQKPGYGKCFPKNGVRHPEDVAFYKKASESNNFDNLFSGVRYFEQNPLDYYESSYPASINDEGRCDIIMNLQSKDITNENLDMDAATSRELLKAGRVYTRTISSPREICHHIINAVKHGANIKDLIVAGHGSTTTSVLGNSPIASSTSSSLDNPILNVNTKFPEKNCLDLLDPNASIILYSCSTGGKVDNGENLADAIARQAGGRKVYAPTKPISKSAFTVNPKSHQKYSFFDGVFNYFSLDFNHGPNPKDITYVAQHKPKNGKI